MLLQISTSQAPATDLGFLLAKNPARVQSFELSFGKAHVFYPEASDARCTVALLLDVDPIALVRGKGSGDGPLSQYVNDRPYVASSFLSVAIAQVLRSALGGQSKERPELALAPIPLEIEVSSVPAPSETRLRELFEPLGYEIETWSGALDARFPAWGQAPTFGLRLRATKRLSEALCHLYVLIPVLDDDKHYFIGEDEVEKLLRRGEGWLESHPLREWIVSRYLNRSRRLISVALERLAPEAAGEDAQNAEEERAEAALPGSEKSLHQTRLEAVFEALKASGARRVVDLGCGEGRLLRLLLADAQFTEIVGLDVSHHALERARDKLKLERMPEPKRERLTLWHGALTYRDARLKGFDAAALVEVVEHLDPARLPAFERAVWGEARPQTIVLTTPNREYNAKWETLPAGTLRHRDHRFEWTRAEFGAWAQGVAARYGYEVEITPLGPLDEPVGAPSQMAVFRRNDGKSVVV